MGADISFLDKNGKEIYYFRDAYNIGNLAWVIGLSYWQEDRVMGEYPELELCMAKAFFIKLSKISDETIKEYVEKLKKDKDYDYTEKDWKELEEVLKDKVKDIKKNLKKILSAEGVEWSV